MTERPSTRPARGRPTRRPPHVGGWPGEGHHRGRVSRCLQQVEVSTEKQAEKKRGADTFEKHMPRDGLQQQREFMPVPS